MNTIRHVKPPAVLIATLALLGVAPAWAQTTPLELRVRDMRPLARWSGHDDYYRVIEDGEGTYLRARYLPPFATMVLGLQVPEAARRGYARLRWRWRALDLPIGGNECARNLGDSAAAVLVLWKRGLRTYVLKYVWSTEAPRGAECDKKDGLFSAQRTVILESGAPVNTWVPEEIVLDDEFRRRFAGGNPRAAVPEFVGVGVLSDGDQTASASTADYGDFALLPAGAPGGHADGKPGG